MNLLRRTVEEAHALYEWKKRAIELLNLAEDSISSAHFTGEHEIEAAQERRRMIVEFLEATEL